MSEDKNTSESADVADAIQVAALVDCMRGFHDWLPWIRLDNGDYATWCAHCGARSIGWT